MINFKSITILLVVALFSAFGGYFFNSHANLEQQTEYKEKYENLQSKFNEISQIDIQEYLKLKNLEARYKKADEILGKILLIMLYDLGIRSSETQVTALKNYVAEAQEKNRDVISVPVGGQASSSNLAAQGDVQNPSPNYVSEGAENSWKKETSKVLDIASPQEATEFLEKVKVDNLFGEIQAGGLLSPRQFESLQGHFLGNVRFWDPNRKPWSIDLTFNGTMENGKYRGNSTMILKEEGKIFSNGSGNIKSDGYLSVNGDSQGIIVESGGGDVYFQLYYFPKLSEFYGLVYTKVNISKFAPQGVVRLAKK